MAFDLRMFESLDGSNQKEFWRIYSWDPPAVSVGKNQNIDLVLDREKLMGEGIEVVRRPTGGRAIYHKDDICISTAGLINTDSNDGLNAKLIYNKFAEILCLFFENIKINTVLTRGPRLNIPRSPGIGKMPCFLSSTPYELMASGKKIAGIALYSTRERYLVQSSIRVKQSLPEDYKFFIGLNPDREMLSNITSIEEESGNVYPDEELGKNLRKVLSEHAGFNVIPLEAEQIYKIN